MGNSPATLANPDGCGSHARRRSARKVLNLKIGRPLDRVLALKVLNPGPEGAVAAHLFQKKKRRRRPEPDRASRAPNRDALAANGCRHLTHRRRSANRARRTRAKGRSPPAWARR